MSVDHLSEDDWRTQIKSDKNLDRWILLARLFKEEGDIYEAVDKFDESHISYLQSLTIFLNVLSDADRTTAQLQFVHVHALVMQLEKYPLALADRFDIFHFYERAGAYAQAEDWLFKSIQAFPDNNQPIQDGISFYERLLAMDDAELVRGDLPRNEVEAALAELRGAAMKSPCYSAARDESG